MSDRDSQTGRFLAGNRAAVKTGQRSAATRAVNRAENGARIRQEVQGSMPDYAVTDGLMVEAAVDAVLDYRMMQAWLEKQDERNLLDMLSVIDRKQRQLRLVMTVFGQLGIGSRARAELLARLGIRHDPKVIAATEAHRELADLYS